MSGSGLWDEPLMLTLGGYPLPQYPQEPKKEAPTQWPYKLIEEAATHYGIPSSDITFEQVKDYLLDIRKESAGPDSLKTVEWILNQRPSKKSDEQ